MKSLSVMLGVTLLCADVWAAVPVPTVWYAANTGVVCNASGEVEVWQNLGSLGKAANLTGSGAVYASDAFSKKGGIRFDGSGALKTSGQTSLGFTEAGGTWVIVYQMAETSVATNRVNQGPFGLVTEAGTRTGIFYPYDGAGLSLRGYVMGTSENYNHGSNAVLASKAAKGTLGSGVLYVGHFAGFNWAKNFKGDIAELRFYGKALNACELQEVEKEVSAKWEASVPGDDPNLIHGAAKNQELATLEWTRTICPCGSRYIGWPTVCKRANGELLAVFSGDRSAHICPWGKVQMVRSTDGGETWSDAVTVRNGAVDDRDAGIMELQDGTFVMTWFSSFCFAELSGVSADWKRHYEKIPYDVLCRDTGYFTARSTDQGKTWETPVKTLGSANHGGIQLRSGRLLMVGRFHNAQGNLVKNYTTDPRLQYNPHALFVEVSDDGARSWQLLTQITPQSPYVLNQFHEPHVVELTDGTLVAQFRYHGGESRTLQSESADGGKTWTPIHETGIIGYPSHLIQLKDGRLLSTYGVRGRTPLGQRAALSADGGKTWDIEHEIILVTHTSTDMGYPSTVELEDGSLLTVYYQAFKSGENPSLMATKWHLK